MSMYSISLPTTYGPAAYQFTLSPTGKVSRVSCSSLDLPAAVLKLTYPKVHPEDLEQHLKHWLVVIPYLLELGIWLEDLPEYLQAVQRDFRSVTQGFSQYQEQVYAADPLEMQLAHPHWQRANAWIKLGVAQKMVNAPLVPSGYTAVFSAAKFSLPYRRFAVAWLIDTFPLAPPRHIDEWIVAIGKSRTTEGVEFLLRELERPGYLPYAKQIYSTLANSRLKLPFERIRALYDDTDKVQHSVNAFVHLVDQFPSAKITDLLEQIIVDYPLKAYNASKRLYAYDPERWQAIIQSVFITANDYRRLIAMLRHMATVLRPKDYFLSLGDINTRLSLPQFLDKTQVTWPQKLDGAWHQVLLNTPPTVFTAILRQYLPHARGRVARNMMLQLKEYLSAPQGAGYVLPADLEMELLPLLHSPYDKVSTVCTDVIRLLLPSMQQPAAAVQALLVHIEVSNYRMMDAAALKVAAQDSDLLAMQQDYFSKRLRATKTKEGRQKLTRIITYLRFLPPLEDLE